MELKEVAVALARLADAIIAAEAQTEQVEEMERRVSEMGSMLMAVAAQVKELSVSGVVSDPGDLEKRVAVLESKINEVVTEDDVTGLIDEALDNLSIEAEIRR